MQLEGKVAPGLLEADQRGGDPHGDHGWAGRLGREPEKPGDPPGKPAPVKPPPPKVSTCPSRQRNCQAFVWAETADVKINTANSAPIHRRIMPILLRVPPRFAALAPVRFFPRAKPLLFSYSHRQRNPR